MQTDHRVSHPGRLSRLFLALALMLTALLTLAPATPALAALVWQIQTLDSAGDAGRFTSLALDASGNPVISYYDNTNDDLKLMHCGNATCSSGNSLQTVDAVGGKYASLALDNSGNPVISYQSGGLKLVHCGNPDCSSGNSFQTLDNDDDSGIFASLALDSNSNPVIAYGNSRNFHLKLAHCGNPDCSSGNSFQTALPSTFFLSYISLVLDSSGNPVISYYIDDYYYDLLLTHCGDANCASGNSIQVVDSIGKVGKFTSLALDNNGNPVISYYDDTNGNLKLAHCGNANCASGKSIQIVDSAGDVGRYTALALDSNGNPVISYYDDTNDSLKLVQCGDATCSSGNTIQTVDFIGDDTYNSSSPLSDLYTSLALDSNDNPVISYYDFTNGDLKLARLIDDSTPPVITPTVNGTLGNNDWYTSDVSVSWSVVDDESAISSQTGCDAQSVTADTAGVTFTCTASSPGGTASQSVTIKRDAGAPTISLAARTPANANGWNNGAVTLAWSCADTTSGALAASVSQTVSDEGAGQSASATCADNAGNSADATETGINIDTTAPSISAAATSSPNGAGWYNGDVSVHFTCADALSGVASCPADELLSSEDAAVASTAQTITDLAGNSSAPSNVVSVAIDKTAPTTSGSFSTSGTQATVTLAAADALSGVAATSYSVNGGAAQAYGAPFVLSGAGSYTITFASTDVAGNMEAPKTLVVTISAATFPATGVLDTFNRANGGVGGNWDGLTGSSFYKIASNKLDVQLGGPLVWKPASFGTSQEAFVTLSTIDTKSPSQGVLLKVQTGSIPNGGAISVVYDAVAKAVRVSTLRLGQNGAWTLYASQAATFANGDVLGARANANGTVTIYKNGAQIASVTLNATDQAFFNAKGGKIGLWTVAAPNAFFDDFGGGTVAP